MLTIYLLFINLYLRLLALVDIVSTINITVKYSIFFLLPKENIFSIT